MGRDFAGVVEEGSFKGKEVYGTSGPLIAFTQDGAHAEYCMVPENAVAIKPKNLSFLQASTVGVSFTTASIALKRARTTTADVVLVLGANGSVGSAVTQLAKVMGCKVITASRRDNTDYQSP